MVRIKFIIMFIVLEVKKFIVTTKAIFTIMFLITKMVKLDSNFFDQLIRSLQMGHIILKTSPIKIRQFQTYGVV
jgi:hypothetical protein